MAIANIHRHNKGRIYNLVWLCEGCDNEVCGYCHHTHTKEEMDNFETQLKEATELKNLLHAVRKDMKPTDTAILNANTMDAIMNMIIGERTDERPSHQENKLSQ